MDIIINPFPHRSQTAKLRVDANGMKQAEYLAAHPERPGRGYHVQIGNLVSLFFACSVYGSDDDTFTAAVLYRDKILQLLNPTNPSNFGLGINKLGCMGVTYNPVNNAYVARWIDEATGARKSKSFAISKHGKNGALQKAIETRIEAVGEYPPAVIEQINLVTLRVIEARRPRTKSSPRARHLTYEKYTPALHRKRSRRF